MDVGSTKRQGTALLSKADARTPTQERPKAVGAPAPFGVVLRRAAAKGARGGAGPKPPAAESAAPVRARPEGTKVGADALLARPGSKRDERGDGGAGGDGGEGKEPRGSAVRAPTDADLLDPATRQLAHLAPPAPVGAAQREAAHETVLRARSLEELLPALVRRIAWAGDRHRGTVRLELGAGAYAGTTVVVHADHGKVRVETFGEGAEVDRLRARLDARLRGHGLDVESVT